MSDIECFALNYFYSKNYDVDCEFKRLIKFFQQFDPVNQINNVEVCNKRINIEVTGNNLEIMNYYLTKLCTYDTLKNPKNVCVDMQNKCVFVESDAIFHSAISILLMWSMNSILNLESKFSEHSGFLTLFKNYIHENDVFIYNNVFFLRNSLDLFRKTFEPKKIKEIEYFKLDVDFHDIYYFSNHLFTNSFSDLDVEKIENLTEPLFKVCELNKLRHMSNVKYITGTACVGKTTLLESLKLYGWETISRGSQGTFSGKAKCPSTMSSLDQSMQYVLSFGNVIGDRGTIDNPLWNYIMDATNPSKYIDLVDDFKHHLESTLNENVLLQYARENVVIIIDLKPEENRKRMMKRAQDGDIKRSRIFMYPYVQNLFYFIMARLVGWKIFCVPYDKNGEFQPLGYEKIINYINQHFPKNEDSNILHKFKSKPLGSHKIDHTYAKNVDIFK